MANAPESATQPKTPVEQDSLVRLFKRLEPLSRGLDRQAKTDAKGFFVRLPRIISGTIIPSIIELIQEVGVRDENHELRIRQLEAVAGVVDEGQDQVGFLLDMQFYMTQLQKAIELEALKITDPNEVEAIGRIEAHQTRVTTILERLGLDDSEEDEEEATETPTEEAADGHPQEDAPSVVS